MRKLVTKVGTIIYLDYEEALRDLSTDDGDIAIVEIPSLDFDKKKILEEKKYIYHDRILNVEVMTKQKKEQNFSSPFFNLEVSTEFDEDVKKLAHQVFTNDGRFHLEKYPNQEKADLVIDAFIDDCQLKGHRVVKCKHENDLMGFIILRDNGDKTASNLLGAVRPDCHGKMSVPVLYGGTVELLREEGFVKELGTISSTNVPSINLHYQLGGRTVGTIDKYIRRISDER